MESLYASLSFAGAFHGTQLTGTCTAAGIGIYKATKFIRAEDPTFHPLILPFKDPAK